MVLLVFLTFFVISFITNIIGPLIPDIINDFELSLTLVALLPFSFFIAYGIISIPSGMLIQKVGEKLLMIIAFGLASFGSLIFASFPNYSFAVISLFLIGCGMAMLQVVINPLLRVAGGEENFAFNATTAQLIFGLASFFSPMAYSYFAINLNQPNMSSSWFLNIFNSITPNHLPWISLYWIFAIISLIMIILIALLNFPKVQLKQDEKIGPLKTHVLLLKNPIVIIYFFGIFTYVGIEQGVANWISKFLDIYHGYDPQIIGANTISLFWGLMTAGGILGVILLKLMDSKIVLKLFTCCTIVCLILALYMPGPISLVAFPAIGFFSAVMYPIIFSLALNSISDHHGTFSGILVTGISGGAVIPLIVGFLGDYYGLKTGMLFLFIPLVFILFIGFWAKPIVSNKTMLKE
jgi:FHS family L-fucose permease-like MFS transporter